MAWTDFYVQSGGSNANGGSTTGSVIYTTAAGAWVNSTNIWTVTDAGAAALTVGDWCNIGGSYVAKISAISNVGSAYTVTMSSTNAFGTKPSNGTYTINDGGPWADLTGVPTFNQTSPVDARINVKYATYSYPSGGGNFYLGGLVWIRGYNTTPGDLDNGSGTLAYPLLSIGSGNYLNSYSSIVFSGLSIAGNINDVIWIVQTGNPKFNHCQFVNTNTNSNARGLITYGSITVTNCYFFVPSTGLACVIMQTNYSQHTFAGCTFASDSSGTNSYGLLCGTNSNPLVYSCTFLNCGKNGFFTNGSNAAFQIVGCTFFGCQGDSIKIDIAPGTPTDIIANCMFGNSGGYDINYTDSAGGAASMMVINNDTYGATSGHLNGFGNWFEFNAITESSNPFVASSATPPDLHLVNTANGAGAALPGLWES